METHTISCAVDTHVLTITLDRQERLNAYNAEMFAELTAAFDMADADPDIRAVIVTGAGRAFCAGADMVEGGTATFDFCDPDDKEKELAWRDDAGRLSLRIYRSLKPVIAAINGPAIGVGITMTLPMDIRLIADNARICFPFAQRGIVPEAASSWFLPRIVGISTAIEWCATGRMLSAQSAHSAGLVRSIHSTDELLPAARDLAGEIAASSPACVTLSRRMLWDGLTTPEPEMAHALESRTIYHLGQAPDAAEGVTSFFEKRPPVFSSQVPKDLPPFWQELL
ncbi:enoyl-CoA hydratase [Croceicoccus estronivorus]|uniref:enoyl-CoA hydratase-related protein n=1 Tax=Croceicoccus estronivorus TaxID=1172626 RepID=UPI00082C7410|nr:enoyl-CoA hydratase-related protein [Croceicoccus estronivorus]OCC23543.1 enoyl-CoA hydratase [Croceicoccus estronivorus]